MPIGEVSAGFDIGLKLEVDIPDDFLSTEEFSRRLPEAMLEIARRGVDFWRSEAGRRLRSSRDKYMDALYVDYGGGDIAIRLGSGLPEDKLVLALEMGAPMYDMKPGLLAQRGRRVIPLSPGGGATIYRTVSDDSPSELFIHPGWPGLFLHETVMEELENNIIPEVIQELVEDMF